MPLNILRIRTHVFSGHDFVHVINLSSPHSLRRVFERGPKTRHALVPSGSSFRERARVFSKGSKKLTVDEIEMGLRCVGGLEQMTI